MKEPFPPEKDDPIRQYKEWAENRYNPGYWVGRVPPSVKNLWSTKDRRWLGMAYVFTCIIALGVTIHEVRDLDSIIYAIIALLPFLVPGLIMLFSKDLKKKR